MGTVTWEKGGKNNAMKPCNTAQVLEADLLGVVIIHQLEGLQNLLHRIAIKNPFRDCRGAQKC